MTDRLTVCSWNADGLRNRLGELIEFLYRVNVDILLLNETRYTNTLKLKIKNYKVIRVDKSSTAGGIAILIKNSIPYKIVQISNTGHIENLCIKLASNVHIICAYCSPNKEFTYQNIESLINVGNRVLLVGDLNAKHQTWNCNRNNRRGRVLFQYAQQNNCSILFPDNPTHHPWNGTTPSTIDIALNKNIRNASDIEVLHELSSDHNPIVITLTKQIKDSNARIQYDYENVDWSKFRQLLNGKLNINFKIVNANSIEQEAQRLTSIIQHCIDKTITSITCKQTHDKLPAYILNLISLKNKIRKKWQTTRLSVYKRQMNRKVNEIRARISKFRNDTWTKKLMKLNVNDNSLWRMTKIFKSEFHPVPTLQNNNTEAITDDEKANVLASQFEGVHAIDLENNTNEQKEITSGVQDFLHHSNIDEEWCKFITSPKEILNEIKKLPSRKAPGLDKIQNIILKNLSRKAIVQITYIINACFKLSYFPLCWKTGNVVPILKPGKNKSEPSSYRPISLLATMSKLAEKIIQQRLNKFERKENIIIDNQFGFREKHNTVQQVIRIINDTSINFNKNNVTVMLLLDIEKAFDRVWIDGLICKMIQYKYPKTLIKLINDYLRNRHLVVTVNEARSTKKKIRAGVPQGSVLGPKLFNIYINDIPQFQKTSLALFADDTAVYAHSFSAIVAAKQIQIHIDILQNYYDKWKISLNATKTELIVFAKKQQNIKIIQPIKIYGHKIEPTNSTRYLGVHLDSKLTFKNHIKQVLRKVYLVQNKMYPIMIKNSPLSKYNKLLIYKMILRPIVTYAAPAWCSAAPTNIKPLQIFQNKCLRLILSVNRYAKITDMHKETELSMITDYAKELGEIFYRSQLNNNPLMKNITSIRQYNTPFQIKHKLPYQALSIFKE